MMGLLVLIVFAVYLLVTMFVVRKTAGWAKASGRKPWLWGGLAAFMMYNLVFWDWVPTVVAHKYYCSTQAGFTVYKTPEKWKSENAYLTKTDLEPLGKNTKMLWDFPYKPLKNNPKEKVLMINQRIYIKGDFEKNIISIIPITKYTSFIADINNDEKLAQLVTFSSGYGNPMTNGGIQGFKGWLANTTCDDRFGVHTPEYDSFISKLISLGVTK